MHARHAGRETRTVQQLSRPRAEGRSPRTGDQLPNAPLRNPGPSRVDDGQRVGPERSGRGENRRRHLQASIRLRQERKSAGSGPGCGVWRGAPPQEDLEGIPDCLVVGIGIPGTQVGRERPEQVLGPRRSAIQEEEPGALQVGQVEEALRALQASGRRGRDERGGGQSASPTR